MTETEPTIEQPLVMLRWALIASLIYMILVGHVGRGPQPHTLVYVGFLLATNLLIPRIPYRNPRTFGSILLALDTIIVLIGVLLCDVKSQELLIGYFLCIVMASFGDSEKRLAGAAFLVTGMYCAWIGKTWGGENQTELLLRLPFLFVTTLFYGYMMQRVRSEHARRLQAELRSRHLDCLLRITQSFSSSLATADVLTRVAETIQQALGVEACSIELVQGDGPSPSSAVASRALEHRTAILDEDPEDPTRGVLALPIVHGVEALGVLVVRTDQAGQRFESEDVDLCRIVANSAAAALKNARSYEDLAEIEKAKSEFLSNLSHEMRTPLNTIIGFTELALERARSIQEAEIAELLARALNGSREMTRNVENLLDLSDATLGRERRSVDRIDLSAMLARNVMEARRVRTQTGVDFSVEVDPTLGDVYTDGDKLERIVGHLLMNAAKFTPKGSVRVSAALVPASKISEAGLPHPLKPWERLLSVSVQDTGVGIAPRDLERLFLDFRQVSGGSVRRYGGLGVGLAVARRLVARLGGAIRVQSQIEAGSRFLVLLPIQLAAGDPAAEPAPLGNSAGSLAIA